MIKDSKNSEDFNLSTADIELSKLSLPLTHSVMIHNRESLKDVVLLHINHALSDVYALNELVVKYLGAQVFFISTPYNNTVFLSNKYHYLLIKRRGNNYQLYFHEKRIKFDGNSHDFNSVMYYAIRYALTFIKKTYQNKNIIVLQDGGYTASISQIHSTHDPFQNLDKLLGMVEQTQGGTRLFKEKNKATGLSYPVLTISRSLIKMRVESHFIAQRIIEEVNRTLYKMGYFLNFKSVILGGYGIIGRPLARCLTNGNSRVVVLEKNTKVQKLAKSENFKTISHLSTEDIDKSFCFIGVTGKCTFGIEALVSFLESKNKIFFLASGSSKRYEFSELIEFFELPSSYQNEVLNKYPILKKIEEKKVTKQKNGVLEYSFKYHGVHKALFMLAEGFPINLYENEIQSVPDRAIDPIQALLIITVIKLKQHFSKLKNGLHHISDKGISSRIGLNEEELLSEWFYLNDINAYRGKPFDFFKPHPLEKLLIKM